jgi:hypothetical protein
MEEKKNGSTSWFLFRHASCIVFGLAVFFFCSAAAVALAMVTAQATKNLFYTLSVGVTVMFSAMRTSYCVRDWSLGFVFSDDELKILVAAQTKNEERKKR